MKIDWDKPIETLFGEKARLLCGNLKRPSNCMNRYIVAIESKEHDGYEITEFVDEYGFNLKEEKRIVNVLDKGTLHRYINIYINTKGEIHTGSVHTSRESADSAAKGCKRIACIRAAIPWTEGQYDE